MTKAQLEAMIAEMDAAGVPAEEIDTAVAQAMGGPAKGASGTTTIKSVHSGPVEMVGDAPMDGSRPAGVSSRTYPNMDAAIEGERGRYDQVAREAQQGRQNRRQVEGAVLTAMDMPTLGMASRMNDLGHQEIGYSAGTKDEFSDRHPWAARGLSALGLVAPGGAPAGIAKAVGGTGRLAPGLLRSMGTGAALGGGMAAGQAFNEGRSGEDIARAGVGGAAVGGVVSGAIGGLQRLGLGRAERLRDLEGPDRDLAQKVRNAEAGGYRTSITRGMKPGASGVPMPSEAATAEAQIGAARSTLPVRNAQRVSEIGAEKRAIEDAIQGDDLVSSEPLLKPYMDAIQKRMLMADKGMPPEAMAQADGAVKSLQHDMGKFFKEVPVTRAEAEFRGAMGRGQGPMVSGAQGPEAAPGMLPEVPNGPVTPEYTPPRGPLIPPQPSGPNMSGSTALTVPGESGMARSSPMRGTAPEAFIPNPNAAPTGSPHDVVGFRIVPRQVSKAELYRQINVLDEASNAGKVQPGLPGAMQDIGGSMREVRRQAFPGLEEQLAPAQARIEAGRNQDKAFGLQSGTKYGDADLEALRPLSNAAARYKSPGGVAESPEVEAFLAQHPELRSQWDRAAGVRDATELSGKPPLPNPYATSSPRRLGQWAVDQMRTAPVRMDPINRALGRANPAQGASVGQAAGPQLASPLLDFVNSFRTKREENTP